MKTVICFDPAVSSCNLGDHIISICARKNFINEMFRDAFLVDISTHLPISKKYFKVFPSCSKFVLGSNLLKANMLFGFRQWDISMSDARVIGPVTLVGCGWWQYQNAIDGYSARLLRTLLDGSQLHSVRDNYTLEKLGSIGIENVINTGCASMWGFTQEFCREIPKHKSENVVTTITDYDEDKQLDNKMLDILERNYKTVYLWPQGAKDGNYYAELGQRKNVVLIPPTLKAYEELLSRDDIEYVGTRLHGGIFALQHRKRAIIIGVDNRAAEKKKDFNIIVCERESIMELESMINASFKTEITINQKGIEEFKEQFRGK